MVLLHGFLRADARKQKVRRSRYRQAILERMHASTSGTKNIVSSRHPQWQSVTMKNVSAFSIELCWRLKKKGASNFQHIITTTCTTCYQCSAVNVAGLFSKKTKTARNGTASVRVYVFEAPPLLLRSRFLGHVCGSSSRLSIWFSACFCPHIEASKLVEPIGWYMLEFILSNHDIFNGFEIHFLDENRSSILALKKVNLAADWYSACTRTLIHELS